MRLFYKMLCKLRSTCRAKKEKRGAKKERAAERKDFLTDYDRRYLESR